MNRLPSLNENDPEHYSGKSGHGCAICDADCFEPKPYLELSGGLSDYAMMTDGIAINLGITVANHPNWNSVKIIDQHKFGQFRIRFCSTECLSKYFSEVVMAVTRANQSLKGS